MKMQFFFKPTILLLFTIAFLNIINAQEQSCLSFDGQDEARIPTAVSQSLGTGDFTFEAWISGLEEDVYHSTILSNRSGGINTGFHFAIHSYWGGSEHKMLMLRYNGINWMLLNNGDFDGKVLDGDCHHVAVSKTRSKLTFFIDGLEIGSKTLSSADDISTNAPILIGSDSQSNSGFNGQISDVRIWNVGLSASEIQEGIENGVDPNDPNLLGYWQMNEGAGQIISNLANQHDAILGSSTVDESIDPKWGVECCSMIEELGECLTFDGDDEAMIPTVVSQSLGTGDFTFEAWISGLEEDVYHSTILSNRTGGINTGFHFAVHSYWGGSEHKMLMLRYNGVNWLHLNNGEFDGKVLDGDCHHVAVSKSREKLAFFIDGKEIGSRTISASYDMGTNAPILIGSDALSSSGFNGKISDVRIWNVGLSASDIQEGMDNGVDPDDPDLLGYWEMKEGEGQILVDMKAQNDALLGTNTGTEFSDPTWQSDCCNVGTLSINEIGDGFNNGIISVFPNPSTGQFNIKLEQELANKSYKYVVYDVLGRIVSNGILTNSLIDLQNISTGYYWLRLNDDIKAIGTVKVIVIK